MRMATQTAALKGDDGALLRLVEQVLLIVSASVSFAGCALIFATWKRVAAPNYLSRRIITSLGLAGLVTAFGFFMSVVVNGLDESYAQHESLCYLQAFTLQYFYLASYLWTGCFAFHLFQIIVRRNEYPEKYLWVYRCVGWGLPGLVLAYLVLRQLTGHLGVGAADRRWCWIAVHYSIDNEIDGNATIGSTVDDRDPSVWRREGALQQLLLFYLPIAVVFVFNAAVYRQILRFLAMDPMAGRFRNKVVLYLGIFFLCSIWGAVNRVVQLTRASHAPNAFLTLMECVCDPLQPLLNALAYGINKRALDAYRDRLCSLSSSSTLARWVYSTLPSSDDDDDEGSSGLDDSSLLANDQLSPLVESGNLHPTPATAPAQHHDSFDEEFAQYFDQPRRKHSRRTKSTGSMSFR